MPSVGEGYLVYETPIGPLVVRGDDEAVTSVSFADGRHQGAPNAGGWPGGEALLRAVGELTEYFSGARRVFSVPVRPRGTPFQEAVWEALTHVPYGTTVTYGALAARLGQPRAVRAVAQALARNPVAVIVPCHRVVGHDGSLTGYAGGLERKAWLLRHERGVHQ